MGLRSVKFIYSLRFTLSLIHGSVGFPLMRFWLRMLTHVNFNHENQIEVRHKVLRLNVKLSEFLLLRLHNCTCSLSYIAFILFANANFTHVRTLTLRDSGYFISQVFMKCNTTSHRNNCENLSVKYIKQSESI